MAKVYVNFQLSVIFLKEKNRFIAYSPALDLSTSGGTHKKAKKRFAEAALLFFQEMYKKGTVNEALQDLGWHKVKKEWKPPVVIGQESEPIRVPVAV